MWGDKISFKKKLVLSFFSVLYAASDFGGFCGIRAYNEFVKRAGSGILQKDVQHNSRSN